MPHVGHRQGEVFGESPGTIHAHALRVSAEVTASRQAIPAPTADNVPFTADDFTRKEVADVRPDLDDLADELVPHDHRYGDRLASPRVPLMDVDIGATNP